MHACVQHTLSHNLGIVMVCVLVLRRLGTVSRFTIRNWTKTSKICFGRVFVKWSAMLCLPAMDVLNAEVPLSNPVGEPKVSHVHALRPLPVEFVIGEAQGDSVVDAE